jgi:AcrR family transcriptional regulator
MAQAARTARRLPPAERHEQLARVALEVAARRGYTGTTLDEVADRAGVTRNLLYHYFPRGRLDLFLAAVELAGEELTGGWVTDPAIPLEERLAANFARVVDYALAPTDAWLVHRQAGVPGEPEIAAVDERYRDVVIRSISENHFGTTEPAPYERLALDGFLGYADRVLDACREWGLERDRVTAILARTLVATVDAARASAPA